MRAHAASLRVTVKARKNDKERSCPASLFCVQIDIKGKICYSFYMEEGLMHEPLEIERKYLIAYPDEAVLLAQKDCAKTQIHQTYLNAGADGAERRVRMRSGAEGTVYTYTEKVFLSAMRRIEREREIGETEYERLLFEAEPSMQTLEKFRYCIPVGDIVYEIDVYPQIQDWAILEIELEDENQKVCLPDFVQVLREVTGEKEYSNKYLARRKK